MQSCRQLLPQAGVNEAWDSPKMCKVLARLDVSMARHLLATKAKKGSKFTDDKAVGRQFVDDLVAAFPEASSQPYLTKFPVVEQVAPASTAKDTAKECSDKSGKLTLYSRDALGNITDPVARLREHGFDIGSYAGSSRGASSQADVYQIAEVGTSGGASGQGVDSEASGQGVVVLRCVDAPGLLTRVGVNEFLESWEQRKAKAPIEVHVAWPSNRASQCQSLKKLVRRSSIFVALGRLADAAGSHVEDQVVIFSKPSRRVVAAKDILVGELVMLPETNSVKAFDRAFEAGGDEAAASPQ